MGMFAVGGVARGAGKGYDPYAFPAKDVAIAAGGIGGIYGAAKLLDVLDGDDEEQQASRRYQRNR